MNSDKFISGREIDEDFERGSKRAVVAGAVILGVVVTVGYAVWRLMQMI